MLLYSGSAAGCWFWLSASLTELSFQIAETGSPSELASRPESQFRQMLDQAGISSVIEPQYLPPLARHDTDSDVTASPTPGRVTYDVTDRSDVTASPTPGRVAFDVIGRCDVTAPQTPGRVTFDDVTPPNGDGRAESPPYSGDKVDLIDQSDEGERGYDNEVIHL